jgi:hypothetical protein
MAGSYRDGEPWRVCLYVDERAGAEQHAALTAISTGQAGGTTLRNYASVIDAVRRANIELDHRRNHWSMRAENFVAVRGATPVESALAISCGIPGHDRPGEELQTELMQVNDSPLIWGVQARCGFATSFAYHRACRGAHGADAGSILQRVAQTGVVQRRARRSDARLAAAAPLRGDGAQRHRGHEPAAGRAGRRRHPEEGRQRHRRGTCSSSSTSRAKIGSTHSTPAARLRAARRSRA